MKKCKAKKTGPTHKFAYTGVLRLLPIFHIELVQWVKAETGNPSPNKQLEF